MYTYIKTSYSSPCCMHAHLCPTLCNPTDCNPQAPLFMGFCRQEYWSGLPFPTPGDLPDPGIKPESPVFAGRFFTTEPPGKPIVHLNYLQFMCQLYLNKSGENENWDSEFALSSLPTWSFFSFGKLSCFIVLYFIL